MSNNDDIVSICGPDDGVYREVTYIVDNNGGYELDPADNYVLNNPALFERISRIRVNDSFVTGYRFLGYPTDG